MSTEQNKALIRRFNEEAWNQGNLDVYDELLAADYVNYTPQGEQNRAQLKAWAAGVLASGSTDYHITIEDLVAEGDKVLMRYSWTFKHTGSMAGETPTGRTISFTGMSLYRLDGGKIVEDWANPDALTMYQQMGIVSQLS